MLHLKHHRLSCAAGLMPRRFPDNGIVGIGSAPDTCNHEPSHNFAHLFITPFQLRNQICHSSGALAFLIDGKDFFKTMFFPWHLACNMINGHFVCKKAVLATLFRLMESSMFK